MYGKELIIDLYKCDATKFTRESIKEWLDKLCALIDMEQEDLHFWDYTDVREDQIPYDQPHLVGISAVQFITTSNIVIHTLDLLSECYINLFSCKDYDHIAAQEFTTAWFGAKQCEYRAIMRGKRSACKNIKTKECLKCEFRGKCSGPGYEKKPCFDKNRKVLNV